LTSLKFSDILVLTNVDFTVVVPYHYGIETISSNKDYIMFFHNIVVPYHYGIETLDVLKQFRFWGWLYLTITVLKL